MDIPPEIEAVYDESSSSLKTLTIGTASTWARSFLDPYRIWHDAIDEDTPAIRTVRI